MSKICTICHTTETTQWYAGPICVRCYRKQYRKEHAEQIKAYQQQYYKKYANQLKERKQQYNKEHAKHNSERWHQYEHNHKDTLKIKRHEYNIRPDVQERRRIYNQQYSNSHRAEINQLKRAYYDLKKNDIHCRLANNLRNRLTRAIHYQWKSGSAVRDLGCTIPELKQHLESLFQPGMTWDNWGRGIHRWNIDHIVPLAKFDLTNREQFLNACHYTNLQPMWSSDNSRKRDRYE